MDSRLRTVELLRGGGRSPRLANGRTTGAVHIAASFINVLRIPFPVELRQVGADANDNRFDYFPVPENAASCQPNHSH